MVAHQINRLEGVQLPVGAIDITLYRDDLDKIGTRTPERTKIPFDLTNRIVVLVDDVIYSGRTIRAALNAVLEYGRPELIRLLVLIDRGHRELPIHPDFVGKVLPTSKDEKVKVFFTRYRRIRRGAFYSSQMPPYPETDFPFLSICCDSHFCLVPRHPGPQSRPHSHLPG